MERLDVYLAKKGMFETREKAKEAIEEGIVMVNGKIVVKPSQKVDNGFDIQIVGEKLKYVSRAGLKLEKAQKEWNINFKNKIVLDCGASTGGFTDFSLQNEAKKVYAVDVGTDQLSPKLASDQRVVNMQKTDFRTIKALPDKIDILVCDCSFISIKLLSDNFSNLLEKGKELVTLIKPQFECGKEIAQKTKGIIKDSAIQEKLKNEIIENIVSKKFKLVGWCDSPILGTAGNKEYLAYFIKE